MLPLNSLTLITGNILNNTSITTENSRKRRRLAGEWQDEPFDASHGEQALWRAVITQALMDATQNGRKPEEQLAKMEAIHWLTRNGPDFLDVCERAGLDMNLVRVRAKKAIANPGHWRTEAGQSLRYAERRAKRQQKKLQQERLPLPLIINMTYSVEIEYA